MYYSKTTLNFGHKFLGKIKISREILRRDCLIQSLSSVKVSYSNELEILFDNEKANKKRRV